jgi:hypothetical protein
MPIEPVDPLADAVSSSVTETTTVNSTITVQPPAEVNKILATMTAFWDWFDKRDVDKHIVAMTTLGVTFGVIRWSMIYAESNPARSGTDIAAILAAINVPLMALQTAVISFYFKARTVE